MACLSPSRMWTMIPARGSSLFSKRSLALTSLVVAAFATLARPAAAADSAVEAELAARPRIGLVLSGGGARGAAHVGVIRVLEEMRIPVDAVAGTSMGSIVGGLYAAGMTPDEMEKALTGVDWNDALTDRTARDLLTYRRKQDDLAFAVRIRMGLRGWKPSLPLGIVKGQKLETLLRSFVMPVATVKDFDDLIVPYRAVAADLSNIEAVVLDQGDLVRAMRASMSVPGVFAPVELDGRLLIDGGVANNLPVDVVRSMGVDTVIAVDIGTPLTDLEKINSPLAVTGQMTTGMMERETQLRRASLTDRDELIVPDLEGFGSAAFTKAGEIIPRGEAAARAVAEKLARFSLSEAAWAEYRARRKQPDPTLPMVREVRIVHDTGLATHFLEELLTVQAGRPLDLAELDRDLRRLYGLDLFERVGYELIPVPEGGVVLEIQAKQRRSGRDYMQFGMALQSDFENDATWDILVRLNKYALNRWGAEWRTDLQLGSRQVLETELYQPLGGRASYFLSAKAQVVRDKVVLQEVGGDQAEVRTRGWGGQLDAGHAFGTWGELRLGVLWQSATLDPVDPGELLPTTEFEDGRASLRFGVDTADDVNFPRRGIVSRVEVARSLEALGAESDVTRALLRFDGAIPFGRNTLVLGVEGGGLFDDEAFGIPFALGGFGRLSGLGNKRLVGRYVGLGRAMYFREVKRAEVAAIEVPIYLGGTLEAGQAWRTEDEIDAGDLLLHGSIFLGIDSPIGPIYVGGGIGQENERAGFILLGRSF